MQIAFLLLVAGNATMVNMINLGVVTLFEHPEQLKELKNDPGLAHNFVEELCRYHQGSAMATRRVAKVDVEYGGKVSTESPIPQSRSTSNPSSRALGTSACGYCRLTTQSLRLAANQSR